MLSKKDCEDFVHDGLSLKRRESFRKANKLEPRNETFDDYLEFLKGIQEVFAPIPVKKDLIKSQNNRL